MLVLIVWIMILLSYLNFGFLSVNGLCKVFFVWFKRVVSFWLIVGLIWRFLMRGRRVLYWWVFLVKEDFKVVNIFRVICVIMFGRVLRIWFWRVCLNLDNVVCILWWGLVCLKLLIRFMVLIFVLSGKMIIGLLVKVVMWVKRDDFLLFEGLIKIYGRFCLIVIKIDLIFLSLVIGLIVGKCVGCDSVFCLMVVSLIW